MNFQGLTPPSLELGFTIHSSQLIIFQINELIAVGLGSSSSAMLIVFMIKLKLNIAMVESANKTILFFISQILPLINIFLF